MVLAIGKSQLRRVSQTRILANINARPECRRVSFYALQRESRQFDNFATCQGRFMGAKAHTSPVGGLLGIREGGALFSKSRGEFVSEMGVTATMPGALREA